MERLPGRYGKGTGNGGERADPSGYDVGRTVASVSIIMLHRYGDPHDQYNVTLVSVGLFYPAILAQIAMLLVVCLKALCLIHCYS